MSRQPLTVASTAVVNGGLAGPRARLDLAVGDPPNRWHPVSWVGRGLDLAFRATPRRGRLAPLLYGMLVVLAGAWAATAVIIRLSIIFFPGPVGLEC